jgi:hypothetical protein
MMDGAAAVERRECCGGAVTAPRRREDTTALEGSRLVMMKLTKLAGCSTLCRISRRLLLAGWLVCLTYGPVTCARVRQ